MAGSCGQCVLATGVRGGEAGELVCASVPGFEGVLSRVAAGGGCRCFRAKARPPVRLEPPEPPNDEIRYIPLTRGLFAIVDAADYEWLNGFKWHATSGPKPYACFGRKDKVIYMHRLIMNPPKGLFVDHVNGNSLDYRRRNLRNCTKAQNAWNRPALGGTSRFKGVHRDKNGKWKAGIRVGGRQVFIGVFKEEVEAARAYDRMAKELFGEFAYLNFPSFGQVVALAGRILVRSSARGRVSVRTVSQRPALRAGATCGRGFEISDLRFEDSGLGGGGSEISDLRGAISDFKSQIPCSGWRMSGRGLREKRICGGPGKDAKVTFRDRRCVVKIVHAKVLTQGLSLLCHGERQRGIRAGYQDRRLSFSRTRWFVACPFNGVQGKL